MTYPLFEQLKMEHKGLFDKAFQDNPPEISEFTFTNLYSWREAYGFEVSMLDSFIILRSKKGFFTPLGNGDTKSVMKRVLKESGNIFIRVPEAAKILFDNDPGIIIYEDRPNSDYLFRVKDLVGLQGRKYDGKRNLIKKFRAENEAPRAKARGFSEQNTERPHSIRGLRSPERSEGKAAVLRPRMYKYSFIEFDASNISRCLDFEEKWCSIKDCDSVEGLDNERRAIKEMVSNFSGFNLIAGAIEITKSIAALAVAERLNSNTLVMHILKADPNIQGLYQVMMNEFLEKHGMGFEYANLEQDLGVVGLRKSKESYHPIRMVNKYTIRLKE